ncbi:hypothetical protein [Rufibacter sp. XAAS-G3-1]|uniref:hypothetical protein n=1 Tax=Rufibacter sp. XAAS-G3-1 TaxID=2729134 RepID=UPI0015E796E7|nr:hypothetical protein [Rufibacter sp. XAAS-G3-1]
MKEAHISFRDWKLNADKELTAQTYLEFEHSSAESCGCDYCKNFVEQREQIFPEEVKKLFSNLGIDFKKEIEVSEFAKLENGLHYYSGWFHFKGDFEGKDCTVPLQNGGHTLELTSITENFSIGFRRDSALTPFKDTDRIVQIEFDCNIPWVLSNEPE